MSVKRFREEIKNKFIDILNPYRFNTTSDSTFHLHENELVKVIQIVHLRKVDANIIGTNTASFTINLGIFYTFIPLEYEIRTSNVGGLLLPEEYQCHVRKILFRSIFQNVRVQKRRDIWFIESAGNNLDRIISFAQKEFVSQGFKWFNAFSNIEYVYRYLKGISIKYVIDEFISSHSSTFGIGRKNSLTRLKLLGHFAKKLGKLEEAERYLLKAENEQSRINKIENLTTSSSRPSPPPNGVGSGG